MQRELIKARAIYQLIFLYKSSKGYFRSCWRMRDDPLYHEYLEMLLAGEDVTEEEVFEEVSLHVETCVWCQQKIAEEILIWHEDQELFN